jgi:hypothetical protein
VHANYVRYRSSPPRVKVAPRIDFPGRNPVTVCIATLFRWNYALEGEPPKHSIAAITASDRMLTAADVQYEPLQQKTAQLGGSIILVAGDIGVHGQALRDTDGELRGRTLDPLDIARIYGTKIQSVNRKRAENAILVPLGLNTDTFQAQQKDFSESFVSSITNQLQNHAPIDTETLVVGSDGENIHIYSVDAYGNETCLDAIGFGAIGIGAWHAKSRLMQTGHINSRILAPTLASIYAAKKNAEIAPGVGRYTDINIILKDGIFPLWDRVGPEMDRLYRKYSQEMDRISNELVAELQHFMSVPQQSKGEKTDDVQGPPGKDAQADAGASSDAAEAPRGNEGGEANGEKGREP